MQLDERNRLRLGRCEIYRKNEYKDCGHKEYGQPVQDPDRAVENARLGIAIGP